jgi:hypothetical protein
MITALLLLLFASGPQTLLDEVFQVPAKEWRYVQVVLKQPPVTVECEFHVISGNGAVRVALVNRDGLDELRQGDREALGAGGFGQQGRYHHLVIVPDEYEVVIENGGHSPAAVKVRVSLDFSERGLPQARYLSPERRFAVIVISATVFLAIVIYSARKLLGAVRPA